jgi:hypothetical protein
VVDARKVVRSPALVGDEAERRAWAVVVGRRERRRVNVMGIAEVQQKGCVDIMGDS